jgi:hypothetical protein
MNWGSVVGEGQVREFCAVILGLRCGGFSLKMFGLSSEGVLDSLNLPSGKESACGISCPTQVPH